jgi:hypothetical protein
LGAVEAFSFFRALTPLPGAATGAFTLEAIREATYRER